MTQPPRFRAVISDLDGVVYRGAQPIPSAVEAFQAWAARGVPFAFVTNNSTRSASDVSDKINAMGIPTTPRQIVTSAMVAARRLADLVPPGAPVQVVGADNLARITRDHGYEVCKDGGAAVLVGLDQRFTYDTLARAQRAILNGAVFLGTNPDLRIPVEGGVIPGAGTLLRAIEAATGVSPIVVGKPQPDLIHDALGILGADTSDTVMIGDQLATDIAAGQAAGLRTVRVRTGVSDPGPSTITPDYDAETLDALLG
ncbi:MAG: HAD-IIA family hydrolase [Marinibacterium sp.]|nr:HAD-IIA family hydrolase [Marinibacterium sp.]